MAPHDWLDYKARTRSAACAYRMLDRRLREHLLFAAAIRQNPDLARREQVQLIFERCMNRVTGSRFRTRRIVPGVSPESHSDHESAGIKGYHSGWVPHTTNTWQQRAKPEKTI